MRGIALRRTRERAAREVLDPCASILMRARPRSFTMASMMASTIFFWMRMPSVHEQYKSAMTITCAVV